jgi:hypothetical protein
VLTKYLKNPARQKALGFSLTPSVDYLIVHLLAGHYQTLNVTFARSFDYRQPYEVTRGHVFAGPRRIKLWRNRGPLPQR